MGFRWARWAHMGMGNIWAAHIVTIWVLDGRYVGLCDNGKYMGCQHGNHMSFRWAEWAHVDMGSTWAGIHGSNMVFIYGLGIPTFYQIHSLLYIM